MNREDVEALLAACERDRIGPHPSNETLAALCRRWLAVEDAPTADVQWDGGAEAYLVFDGGPEEMRGCRWNAIMSEKLDGQRVRIVPEAGQGGG